MTDQPKRPWWRKRWWRKRRWLATLAVAAVLAYPLSFVPACWTLMRLDPRTQLARREIIAEGYRPVATALAAGPADALHVVCGVVNLGAPGGASLVARGGRIGVQSRETSSGETDTTVVRWVW